MRTRFGFPVWAVLAAAAILLGAVGVVVRFGTAGAPAVAVAGRGLTAPAASAGSGPAGAARYVALAPARLLDTRGAARPGDASVTTVAVAGRAGVPADAASVALNVTVTDTTAPGFVTVWPSGTPRPLVSNLNVERADQTIANLVVVPVGGDGAVSVFTQAGTDLVVDVVGAWEPAATATAGRLVPVGPARLLDSRSGPILAAGTTQVIDLGPAGAGASGAVLNVTATEAGAPGFLTVWAAGGARPDSSNLNVDRAGQTVANLVVTPVSADGKVAVFAQSATHLVVDLVAVFTGAAAPESGAGLFVPIQPTRVLDSRDAAPLPALVGGRRADLALAGQGGLPAGGAAAVIVNLTATEASDAGYVTAYPARTPAPLTSSLNVERTWQTVANLAVVGLGAGDAISLFAQRRMQLVADLSGWFTGAPATADPSVPAEPPVPPAASSDGTLREIDSVAGSDSPKSVVATGTGLIFAQNMIYSHNVTVYGRDHRVLTTISDLVGGQHGGPVEAAVTPDKRSVYVSNYSMYGPGAGPAGFDACTAGDAVADSTVYRIGVASLSIEQVIRVGKVPKFLEVSPDGRLLVVSNWCGDNISIVDIATGQEIRRVAVGHNPRGIAITADSRTAYIAAMGSNFLAVVDLATGTVRHTGAVGGAPRHLNLSPDGRWLYITLNADGTVAKFDTTTEAVVARVATGTEPRSAALAADGANLYVVNYGSASVSKVRTADMTVVQRVPVITHPIGVTYDDETRQLWVACYVGRVFVFQD